MKATYKNKESYKIIVVAFDENTLKVADCATLGDVSDVEIDTACSANGANIEGWTCELAW